MTGEKIREFLARVHVYRWGCAWEVVHDGCAVLEGWGWGLWLMTPQGVWGEGVLYRPLRLEKISHICVSELSTQRCQTLWGVVEGLGIRGEWWTWTMYDHVIRGEWSITSITNLFFLGGYRTMEVMKSWPCTTFMSITNFILLGRLSLIKIEKCWEVNGLTSITKFKMMGRLTCWIAEHGPCMTMKLMELDQNLEIWLQILTLFESQMRCTMLLGC